MLILVLLYSLYKNQLFSVLSIRNLNEEHHDQFDICKKTTNVFFIKYFVNQRRLPFCQIKKLQIKKHKKNNQFHL